MLNQVFLEGRLVADPKLTTTKTKKTPVTKITVACHRNGYAKGVDYVVVQAWGTIAENLCKYKKKGGHVIVIGALMSQVYEDYKRDDIRETLVNASYIEYMEDEIKNKQADGFFEEYPEIYKLYKKYTKELKEKKKNESDSIEQGEQ